MRRPDRSLPAAYFERLYAQDPDPWRFASSPYERAKYDATIEALSPRRYGRALEVGCAIGVLTVRLAGCCERLLALDVAETALVLARERCRDLPNVAFAQARFPEEAPEGAFDLVVLSEVVYYWSKPDAERAAQAVADRLEAGGDLLLVHWIKATDYPLSGDDAVAAFLGAFAPPVRVLQASRTDSYRLDLLRREPDSSVGA